MEMCYTQFLEGIFLFDPIGLENIIDSLHIDFHWDYNSQLKTFRFTVWIQEDTAGSIHYFIRVCAFQSILEGTKKDKKYVGTFSKIRKIYGSDFQYL